jgi:hypothetical protein
MPVPAPPHDVPAGPFAVRWHSYELPQFRAGASTGLAVDFENAGSATWRSLPGAGVYLAYHWLDLRGNPIVWAGAFVPLPHPVAPGERLTAPVELRAPIPPGRYRLAIDLLDERRAWFSELGNHRLEHDVDVASRLTRRSLAVEIAPGPAELVATTKAALAALEEPAGEAGVATAYLAAGCRPAPDWSRLILDAHEEGFAAVAGSVDVERAGLLRGRAPARELEPWKPGFGRAPAWERPLVCPSLLTEAVTDPPWTDAVAGLPALDPTALAEPWLCDGRIQVSVAATGLPRVDRRSG